MKNKTFKLTILTFVGILLFWFIYLMVMKKNIIIDKGDYFFYQRKREVGFVLSKDYIMKLFSIKGDKIKYHLFITSFGYRHIENKSDVPTPMVLVDGPYRSLGCSENVIIATPKYFDCDKALTTEVKIGKDSFAIDGEEISIYCSECKKLAFLFLNYKEKDIKVEEVKEGIEFNQIKTRGIIE